MSSSADSTSTAAPEKVRAPSKAPQPKPPQALPPWRVILHNDDINTIRHVVESLMEVVRIPLEAAVERTVEADRRGLTQVALTHQEHAEFLADGLRSKRLTASIEPAR